MMLPGFPLYLSLLPTREGVYIVGGTTRDLLLGKTPVDYDIAVSRNPEIFAEKTAHAYHGRLVRMGRPGKRSFRIVTGDAILDITGVNGPSIRHDLENRDITINAMAIELASGTLLDWVEGQKDLGEKRIRMVSAESFRNDPIRLLRAFRLATALGFSIENQTVSAISRDAPLIHHSAGERIRSELFQLFSCRNSSPHLDLMAKTGLLRAIFPELPAQPETNAPPQPSNLEEPFLPSYHRLETLLNHPPPGYPPKDMNTESSLPSNPAAWLKLAQVLIRRNRFPDGWAAGRSGGEALSENNEISTTEAAEAMYPKLRLSIKEKTFVNGIVCNHTRPFHLYNEFTQNRLTPKTVTRFFMDVGFLAPHLLLCALAEVRSEPTDMDPFSNFFRHILHAYNETYLPAKTRPPLVSGRDLISVFELPPSPLFETILTRLEEKRLSGEVTDRASALQMAEKLIRDRI